MKDPAYDKFGFLGGNLMTAVGPASDIQAFFDCVGRYAPMRSPEVDFSLLTERFYRRYLRYEQLEPALSLMSLVQVAFAGVPARSVDWGSTGLDPEDTRLEYGVRSLADVFERILGRFRRVVEAGKYYFEDNFEDFADPAAEMSAILAAARGRHIDRDFYLPVYIGRVGAGGWSTEADFPLEEFEIPDRVPFWQRPDYTEESVRTYELALQKFDIGTVGHYVRLPDPPGGTPK